MEIPKLDIFNFLLVAGIASIALVLDLIFPLGVAGGITQIIPVLFGFWLLNQRQFFLISILAVWFVILGYFLSPSGGEFWVVALNRILSIVAVLACSATIYFALFHKVKSHEGDSLKPDIDHDNTNLANIFSPSLIVIAIASLLFVVGILFFTNKETTESQERVSHTREVQGYIGRVLSVLQDLETGQRGFLLTGDSDYLEPFSKAIQIVERELLELRRLTSDNIDQQGRNRILDELIDKKIIELEETIKLRKEGGFDAALELVKSGVGKEYMDQIRGVLLNMENEESLLLVEREKYSQTFHYYSMFASGISVLIILWIGIILAFRINAFIRYRDQAEASLRTIKEEAETANLAKSRFLSAMSHELRTPLNSILGFSKLLDKPPTSPLNDSQRESVAHIINSGDHLLNLINKILDLAKIESGALELSLERLSVKSVVDPCIAMAKESGMRYGIEVKSDVLEDESIFIMADITRTRQILINLLSNAVKYNQPKGSVHLNCTVKVESVRFSVSDTGKGISKEKFDDLFKPFERLNQNRGAIEGSGIGLSITKELVERMGGTIGVESEMGEGSTFWFELPKADGLTMLTDKSITHHEKAVVVATTRKELTEPKRIIYIEDNPANTDLMKLIFSSEPNLTLETFETAEAGIEVITKNPPDLVLMDNNLPGMDGIEATRILKYNNATKSVPIIGVSANAMSHDFERAADAGMDIYITKPFQPDEVLESITEILGAEVMFETIPDSEKGVESQNIDNNEPLKILSAGSVESIRETAGKHPKYLNILRSMFNAIPSITAEMRTALSINDGKAVERAAHRIKTNGATLGAIELADWAQKAENAAERDDLAVIPNYLQKIDDEYHRVSFAVDVLTRDASDSGPTD